MDQDSLCVCNVLEDPDKCQGIMFQQNITNGHKEMLLSVMSIKFKFFKIKIDSICESGSR